METTTRSLESLELGEGTKSTESKETEPEGNASKLNVVYKFCDIQTGIVDSWKEIFKDYIPDKVQVE